MRHTHPSAPLHSIPPPSLPPSPLQAWSQGLLPPPPDDASERWQLALGALLGPALAALADTGELALQAAGVVPALADAARVAEPGSHFQVQDKG